ncbi:MAG: hypothetical protein KGQ37_13475 [Hyphomicrobiales bacterium]|nr:hypothetical protein [Hyphomicrobiales bacterium]
MSVTFAKGEVLVSLGQMTARLATSLEDDELVIELDHLTHWQPPDDAVEVTLEDLMAITVMIEREADRLGLAIAFA